MLQARLQGLHVVLCVPWYASDATYSLNPRRAVCLCACVYCTPNHALPTIDQPTVAVEGVSAQLVASLDPKGVPASWAQGLHKSGLPCRPWTCMLWADAFGR